MKCPVKFPLPLSSAAFFLLLFASVAAGEYSFENMKKITHVLKPGQERRVLGNESDFQLFCRIGDHKYVSYYFRTAMLRIISSAEDIRLLKGSSPKEVYLQHKSQGKLLWWLANKLPWRARDTHFPTFNTSCVGIQSSQGYTAALIIKPIDPWKVLTFLAGVALYILAPNLSRSTVFFYSSGTLVGGLAAVLVLLFIVSRFLPKSNSGKAMMGFMWTTAFYFAGETYKKLEDLVQEKMHYIVVYLVVGGLFALVVCYRWGPPQHPRTLNIIRWALQLFGLVMIHFSSDFVEMSTALILLLLSYSHFRPAIIYHCEKYYYRWFPSKRRLLTEEEYITQAAVETQKGLKELREFCSSPDANPWKIVSRLKDPRRFSSFMSGGSHLNDDEILGYEAIEPDDDRRGLLTDDSGDEDSSQINEQNHLETTDDES